MRVVTGVDLIYLPRFKKSAKEAGENFLRRIYLESEVIKTASTEHLAGIFAAKEAVIKALGLNVGSWQDIMITYDYSGVPKAKILKSKFLNLKSSLSISHDGNYIIAQFVALLK